MAYKVLYRKFRPTDFENVVGQEYTIQMLKNAIINKKTSHAYLFTGPRGTGKTSTAKIFAKALNCENPKDGSPCNECDSCRSFSESPDIIELDAASNNSVEDIREIINNVKLVPASLKYKIYIIDEVHMLSPGAFNALLLTLEEPPSHVVFILATTEIQKVPITILSRCQRFDFKPVPVNCIIDRLKYISNEENITITDDALEEIALISAGGMRDALGILDQLSSGNNEITADIVTSNFGSVSTSRIESIINNIFLGNNQELVNNLEEIKNRGTNYNIFIEKLVLELRKKAIDLKLGNNDIDYSYDAIYELILDLNNLLGKLNININPYILIEITLLKYVKSDKNSNLSTSSIQNNGSSNYFPGNNLVSNSQKNDAKKSENNYLGNNNIDEEKSLGNKTNSNENTSNVLGNNLKEANNGTNIVFDVTVRINNCFVDASKDDKKKVSSSWVDFMNYLMRVDRNMVSLLADSSILASSSKYSLIQSKSEGTNNLINIDIIKLEKYYNDFSGVKMLFAAVNDDLWKKEVEKYRLNLKNKIKYKYIEEKILSSENISDNDESMDVDDIEKVASEIFDSFEIE